jgi:hypothetical protein
LVNAKISSDISFNWPSKLSNSPLAIDTMLLDRLEPDARYLLFRPDSSLPVVDLEVAPSN